MTAPKHDYRIDLEADSSHTRIIGLVGAGKRVLEVGCATGYMSRVLVERLGCTVTGIELDADAAEAARKFCARVIVGDVERLDLDRELGDARYDVIVCADVLEHLPDPAGTLAKLRRVLGPGGYVVGSIPNVAHAAVIAELLAGRFRYRPSGLLDEGHVRFFTRDTIYRCFEDAGLQITHLDRLVVEPEATEFAASLARFSREVAEAIEAHDESKTYQFVVSAVPAERVPETAGGAARAGAREPAWPPRATAGTKGDPLVEALLGRMRQVAAEQEARAHETGVLTEQVRALRAQVAHLARSDAHARELEAQLAAMKATRGWRALERLRAARAALRRLGGARGGA